MTEAEAEVAVPSLPYTDEDLVIVSGVQKEHESNVYGYISTMDYQVLLNAPTVLSRTPHLHDRCFFEAFLEI